MLTRKNCPKSLYKNSKCVYLYAEYAMNTIYSIQPQDTHKMLISKVRETMVFRIIGTSEADMPRQGREHDYYDLLLVWDGCNCPNGSPDANKCSGQEHTGNRGIGVIM